MRSADPRILNPTNLNNPAETSNSPPGNSSMTNASRDDPLIRLGLVPAADRVVTGPHAKHENVAGQPTRPTRIHGARLFAPRRYSNREI